VEYSRVAEGANCDEIVKIMRALGQLGLARKSCSNGYLCAILK
jgi:hypothetical protein